MLEMRGNRFQPLTYDEMNEDQQRMTDHILSGARGTMDGPYNVLLRSPIMGDLAQQFGAHLRFHSSLPQRLNELAILLTARHWNSEFEWYVHHQFALNAGLDADTIQAVARGRRPDDMRKDEKAVFDFCDELFAQKFVSDATFMTAREILGEQGIVDLIGALAYYHLVSMILNVDGYPLPNDALPQFRLPTVK
jgi:4-carboxymuconolactone decarboxylase